MEEIIKYLKDNRIEADIVYKSDWQEDRICFKIHDVEISYPINEKSNLKDFIKFTKYTIINNMKNKIFYHSSLVKCLENEIERLKKESTLLV